MFLFDRTDCHSEGRTHTHTHKKVVTVNEDDPEVSSWMGRAEASVLEKNPPPPKISHTAAKPH